MRRVPFSWGEGTVYFQRRLEARRGPNGATQLVSFLLPFSARSPVGIPPLRLLTGLLLTLHFSYRPLLRRPPRRRHRPPTSLLQLQVTAGSSRPSATAVRPTTRRPSTPSASPRPGHPRRPQPLGPERRVPLGGAWCGGSAGAWSRRRDSTCWRARSLRAFAPPHSAAAAAAPAMPLVAGGAKAWQWPWRRRPVTSL